MKFTGGYVVQSSKLLFIHLKVANDAHGRSVLDELRADGVDTSFFVVNSQLR